MMYIMQASFNNEISELKDDYKKILQPWKLYL